MGNKVAYSDDADAERAKLPTKLRDELEKFLGYLARNPEAPGATDSKDFQGVAIDGSYFNVTAFYRYREGDLFVNAIDIISH